MYVRRTLAMTSPSRTMPTPILLALPSNPMDTTIFAIFSNSVAALPKTDQYLPQTKTMCESVAVKMAQPKPHVIAAQWPAHTQQCVCVYAYH